MPRVEFNSLNHEQIRDNFVQASMVFYWKDYIIRCAMDCDGNDRKRTTWPFVYGMSEWQWINSAMWDVKDASAPPKLVGAWVFSPGGDETNLLHLPEYASDVFEFHELAKEERAFPLASCCDPDDAFSCSSGDSPVETFRCPALETLFPNKEALEKKSTYEEQALTMRRGTRFSFYVEDDVEYDSEPESEDENEDDENEVDENEDERGLKEEVKALKRPAPPESVFTVIAIGANSNTTQPAAEAVAVLAPTGPAPIRIAPATFFGSATSAESNASKRQRAEGLDSPPSQSF